MSRFRGNDEPRRYRRGSSIFVPASIVFNVWKLVFAMCVFRDEAPAKSGNGDVGASVVDMPRRWGAAAVIDGISGA